MSFLKCKFLLALLICICYLQNINAQILRSDAIHWTKNGNSYTTIENGTISETDIKTSIKTTLINQQQLTPAGSTTPLNVESFTISNDENKVLIFTNTAKVWRYHTRGDYWVLDIAQHKLTQLGKSLPSQSLMFTKLSPDGKNAAYVSEHNIYTEDISSGKIMQLTF